MSRLDEKRQIETSWETVEYTTIDLIKEIEEHPVLWNRHYDNYGQREAIDEAWDEISRNFVPFYDDLDEYEKPKIVDVLRNRWRNCIAGLMKSAALKRKNDRLYKPFTYGREMRFYLEYRGVKFEDMFNSEDVDGIDEEKSTIKIERDEEDEVKEVSVEESEIQEEKEPAKKKSKKADTSTSFRSARLREKQSAIDKSVTEENTSTPKTQKNTPSKILAVKPSSSFKPEKNSPIKRTPVSNSTSTIYSKEDDSEEDNEEINEEPLEHHETVKSPEVTVQQSMNHSVHQSCNYDQPQTFINESDASDQMFFDSIKPALSKMNETQKLDFQIDILQILKSFRTN